MKTLPVGVSGRSDPTGKGLTHPRPDRYHVFHIELVEWGAADRRACVLVIAPQEVV